jgi:hypothetical protein
MFLAGLLFFVVFGLLVFSLSNDTGKNSKSYRRLDAQK